MQRVLQQMSKGGLNSVPRMQYIKEKHIDLRKVGNGYYANPEDVARRLIKVIALHDQIKAPELIKLESTWHELGLGEMALVEVMVEVEREFEIEMPDEDIERFRNVNDAVEYISRSFFTI